MNQLSLLTGGANNAHNGVVGESTRSANPPQTPAFTVRLEALPNLFGRDMAMIIQGVKPFIKGLLALGAEIPLAAIGGFTMFMSAGMNAQTTFHKFCWGVVTSLRYATHYILMHYHTTQPYDFAR